MTWSDALRPPLRPPMPVRHDAQHAPRCARMADQRDLVLLVFAVTLVDAGGGGEPVTLVAMLKSVLFCPIICVAAARLLPLKHVLSNEAARDPQRLPQGLLTTVFCQMRLRSKGVSH